MRRSLAAMRQEAILKYLQRWGALRNAELCTVLGVTERTLQRDLDQLEARGILRRVHGGAVMPTSGSTGRLRIGLIVPTRKNYYTEVVEGAQQVAASANVQLVIGDHFDLRDLEEDRLKRSTQVDLDGLLVTTSPREPSHLQLNDASIPTVLVERLQVAGPPMDPALPIVAHVGSDHVAGAMLALDHLYELGHRRVHCLIRLTPTGPGVVRGIDLYPARDGLVVTVAQLHHGEMFGSPAAMDEVVHHVARGATALLVHNDLDAAPVIRCLQAAGYAVPGRVSVLSYDGVETAGVDPPLSSVSPQRRWIGRIACELLVDHLRASSNRAPDWPRFQLSLTPELVIQASTGPVPTAVAT